MMRFLTPILRKLFKPVPPMDLQTDDQISRDIEAAVSAHELVASSDSERRVREAMDDLFARFDKKKVKQNG